MKLMTLRKLHKWVGLVLGLQLLLWSAGGVMFAWLGHDAVTGHGLAAPAEPLTLPDDAPVAEPTAWIGQLAGREIHEVRLQPVGSQWIYRVAHAEGAELRRAADGQASPIDAATARDLALQFYRGDGILQSVAYLPTETLESRRFGATWQADFEDSAGTSLYIAADSGKLAVVRTDTWRVFDFFWMLHTMDYVGRDDFNNPVVILAGSAGLWIALTGLLLIFRVFKRSDFIRQK